MLDSEDRATVDAAVESIEGQTGLEQAGPWVPLTGGGFTVELETGTGVPVCTVTMKPDEDGAYTVVGVATAKLDAYLQGCQHPLM